MRERERKLDRKGESVILEREIARGERKLVLQKVRDRDRKEGFSFRVERRN